MPKGNTKKFTKKEQGMLRSAYRRIPRREGYSENQKAS